MDILVICIVLLAIVGCFTDPKEAQPGGVRYCPPPKTPKPNIKVSGQRTGFLKSHNIQSNIDNSSEIDIISGKRFNNEE